MQGDSHSIKNPLLNVQTHSEDADPRPSRCPDCCLFPVISPSGKHVDARLHGTLLKDVPWIGAVLVTLGVLFIIIIGLMLRHHGADAPIVNVNIGQFNMIAGLMLLTWFGWGYAVCCKLFYAHDINYVVGLNLGTPPIADPSRPERYLSALGVARLTALIAVLQGLSLVMCIALWRYLHFDASAVVVFLVFLFHIFFLLIPRLFERDSRLALRSTILRCLAAPLFQVLFIDNVVGDVLTSSQVALSRIQLSICSLFEGLWWVKDISSSFASTTIAATPSVVCSSSSSAQLFYAFPAINIFPFWIRFFQCMRKWWDERHGSGWKKTGHLVNAGKYVSCIILVVADTLQKVNPRPFVSPLSPIQGFWLAAAVAKTLYCSWWDLRCDWGLLQPGQLLRSNIKFPRAFYYWAIASNILLRCAWALAMSPNIVTSSDLVLFALQMAEIFRRMQWFMIRVEWECCSNSALDVQLSLKSRFTILPRPSAVSSSAEL